MGEAARVLESKVLASRGEVKDYIQTRKTPELVIGFCGALGSGVSTAARQLLKQIESSSYDYKVEYLSISKIIEHLAPKVINEVETDWYSGFDAKAKRIGMLQENGNALRRDFTNDILAQFAIGRITTIRADKHFKDDEKKKFLAGSDPKARPRTIWIIDSLKHPNEAELLRCVYGNMFYLIGVLCPQAIRETRLRAKGLSATESSILIEKDKSDKVQYGQKLIDTIFMADFFVNNSKDSDEQLETAISRYIKILFGEIVTPTKDEYAMFVAQSSAYNSACLSRQVGSAITDENGSVISYGCNDVPKSGGGLYSCDCDDDNRCYRTHDKQCANDKEKDEIAEKIKSYLDKKLIPSIALDKFVEDLAKYSGIKNITEYSKAVHAEMDAILKIARKGGNGLQNGSMFVTTFPCHNCAKHIVASGIRAVYYIEPYEKSLAPKLHHDSITLDPSSETGKVKFMPFNGVAPRQFQNFFKIHGIRKLNDEHPPQNKYKIPVSEKFVDTFTEYEAKVIESLSELSLSGMLTEDGG